ncbi:MAG: winged helix-turn-helix transcriptional regulator [Deltaproteobacteria bacterium]|nr:winged helix-turn-helix transcriptional regulator [Deltaproteobacteria bacterium]MBW2090478.1 winged helix-turn-helix transcriptional regulator [Deltaproteobacteria bacterium]MBW2320735.1 winged helix-turn-helix transcriptional regulator [Deltaproteobacteria bacterium]RLB75286.1 MAG: transcriptional regulator [Deltaproteobacteria bacterium]HGY11997.1 ArsR family transcriptional regulator [Desulfobacterales bacterium]
MKNFIRVMKALADPNRTIILKLLQKQCLCVCEITDVIKLKQPSVSKHLKILENAGLVSSQKKAQRVCYKITNGEDSPYAAAMLGNLRHWLKEAEKTGQA